MNGGTYEKYKDSAVSFILGPSRSIPVQIPAHNLIQQGGEATLVVAVREESYTSQHNLPLLLLLLVNTHNTYNGNPGKQFAYNYHTFKFTEIILRALKEGDKCNTLSSTAIDRRGRACAPSGRKSLFSLRIGF